MKQTVEIILMNGGPVLVTLDAEDHPAATEKLGKVLTALCAEHLQAQRRIADLEGQLEGARDLARRVLGE